MQMCSNKEKIQLRLLISFKGLILDFQYIYMID